MTSNKSCATAHATANAGARTKTRWKRFKDRGSATPRILNLARIQSISMSAKGAKYRNSTSTREYIASAATEGNITNQAPLAKLPQASALLDATHSATNPTHSAPLFENILRYRLAARNNAHSCPFNWKCGRTPSYQ